MKLLPTRLQFAREHQEGVAVFARAQPTLIKLDDNGKRRMVLRVEQNGVRIEIEVPDPHCLTTEACEVWEWTQGWKP